MSLPKEAIYEFIDIYKDKTGEELSFSIATEKANKFFEFMKIITKPLEKKEGNDNTGKS